jgi:hypothetical protein
MVPPSKKGDFASMIPKHLRRVEIRAKQALFRENREKALCSFESQAKKGSGCLPKGPLSPRQTPN